MVIILLAIISIGFFFTLGLHYGKKINTIPGHEEQAPQGKLEESPESVPGKDVLEQASRHALIATEDSIDSATKEELKETGVKLEAPKQVDLPAQKISPKAKPVPKEETHARGKFAIQLGSFGSRAEATAHVKTFTKHGVASEIKVAIVGGVTRYRVVVAGFQTKKSADDKAKDLKRKKKIDSFVVIKD